MLAGLLVLGIVVLVAAPVIIPAITPSSRQVQWDRTVDLTRIMVLSPIFLALGSLVTSVLNARGRFAASAIAPIVYNLAIIGAAVGLTAVIRRHRPRDRRRRGLARATSLIQLAPLRAQGFRYERADRRSRTPRHGRRSGSWPRGRSAWAPGRSRSSS